jgi:hypothetical protein
MANAVEKGGRRVEGVRWMMNSEGRKGSLALGSRLVQHREELLLVPVKPWKTTLEVVAGW